MGLYAKARKFISSQETEGDIASSFIDFSPVSDQENEPAHINIVSDALIARISKDIDQDSRFIIIGISLEKIIEGISLASTGSKQDKIASDVFTYITKSASYIAHPYQVTKDKIVLLVQTQDSVDLEMLVHQIYNSLRSSFVGCPGENCSIFNSKARIFPQDGNDVRKLIACVI
jgi:hypothetical protein